MRILDTAERKRKEDIKEDLRKAIKHTLDNVDADEAWEALGESLQDAMNAIGLGPGDKDGELAETIALVAMALAVRKEQQQEQEHPMWLIEVGDSPLTPEDVRSVKEQIESWSSTGPGDVILMSEPVFVGKFVTLDDPEKHAGLLRNFSMGCAVSALSCPFCDGDEECDC